MKIVGTTRPIHDARQKAAGRAIYSGDITLPGMLHISVLFSPVPHAKIRAVHTEKAEAVPGVEAVLSCFNTPDRKFSQFLCIKGEEGLPAEERVFPDQVRFVGDRVACVVADKPETARTARDLIEVEYDELPFTTDMKEALDGKINCIHPNGAVYGDFELDIGDENEVEESAVETVTRSALARVSHITMEPHACAASYDSFSQRLTIWSSCQSVHAVRSVIADLFELPYHRVRVIKTTMGGSFGSKQEWVLEPIAAAAALATGRPVKLVFSRAETMASTISRCPLEAVVKSKVTRDGKLRSFDTDANLNAGAYLADSFDYVRVIGRKYFRCYTYPHMRYRGRAVCTNTPVSGAYRGWGSPELAILIEHNLNMAARNVGVDPVELRLINAAPPGTIDPINHESLGEMRFKECIERARDLFEWGKKREEDSLFNQTSKRYRRGSGIGCGGHINGYFPRVQDFAAVGMRMAEDGSVIANVTLHDHGCGAVTAHRMIIAETLGVPFEMIHIAEGDTDYTALDIGCLASRTVYVLGRTTMDCAEKLKRSMLDGVAELHAMDVGELEAKEGRVRSRDGSVNCSYGEASTRIMRELQRELQVTHAYINKSNPSCTGVHFAQVEVDVLTGLVKILDYVAVHDVGRVINREMCVAQVQGAVLMGSGAALSEHMKTDARNGRSTSTLKDYHLVNAPDAPRIRVDFIEDGGTDGPFGAKSIGEASHVPVAPAIIAAVNEALDSDMCELPLSPDAILEFLAKRRVNA